MRAPDGSIGERLSAVFRGLEAVLAEHPVELVAVEEAFYGKNVRSAIRLGEGRAMAILAASLRSLPVVELAPSLVKKAVTGHGAATKEQVRDAIEATLANGRVSPDLPLDATDALALAVAAHVRTSSPVLGGPPPRRSRRGGWTAADLARLGVNLPEEDGG